MESRITLVLNHEPDHRPAPPVVELAANPDGDISIWFRDLGDTGIVLEGCPACLVWELRQVAQLIEERTAVMDARLPR